jgi:hypothetical protein
MVAPIHRASSRRSAIDTSSSPRGSRTSSSQVANTPMARPAKISHIVQASIMDSSISRLAR